MLHNPVTFTLVSSPLKRRFSVSKVVFFLVFFVTFGILNVPFSFHNCNALFTMGTRSVSSVASLTKLRRSQRPTPHVSCVGNGFQVAWIDTQHVSTNMIYFSAFWNRAYVNYIAKPMGEPVYTNKAKDAIDVLSFVVLGSVSGPLPATIAGLNFGPECFLNRQVSFSRHVSPPCDFQIGVGGASSGVASIPGGFDGRPYPLDKNNTKGVV